MWWLESKINIRKTYHNHKNGYINGYGKMTWYDIKSEQQNFMDMASTDFICPL